MWMTSIRNLLSFACHLARLPVGPIVATCSLCQLSSDLWSVRTRTLLYPM